MSARCITFLLDNILSGDEPDFDVFDPAVSIDMAFEHVDDGSMRNWIDRYPELTHQLLEEFYSRDLSRAQIEDGFQKLRKYLVGVASGLLDFEATEAFERHNGG